MVNFRWFCLMLGFLACATAALGQIKCRNKCLNLVPVADDNTGVWNDVDGNCYGYQGYFGQVMYCPNPTWGVLQLQEDEDLVPLEVVRFKYDDCDYYCTSVANPQQMIVGGRVTRGEGVFQTLCVFLTSTPTPVTVTPPGP